MCGYSASWQLQLAAFLSLGACIIMPVTSGNQIPRQSARLFFFFLPCVVRDLLRCKSLPHPSGKAVPLERGHVTSDAKPRTSAHPCLCLRFGRHGDKTGLQQHAAQPEGCSHQLSHRAGRWKWLFPLTASEEQGSRNFLSGS